MPLTSTFQAILEAILPYYLNHIKDETTRKDNPSAVREEMQIISSIATSMRALISSSETLSRLVIIWAQVLMLLMATAGEEVYTTYLCYL